MNKAELLTALRTSRAEWEAVLAEVAEWQLARPGVAGSWSLRDIIALHTADERWVAAMLTADLRGRAPSLFDLYGQETGPPADVDRVGWVVELNRPRPLSVVLAESCLAHRWLLAALEALPESLAAAPGYFAWCDGRALLEIVPNQSFNHYRLHLPAIRRWLQQPEQREVCVSAK